MVARFWGAGLLRQSADGVQAMCTSLETMRWVKFTKMSNCAEVVPLFVPRCDTL